MKTKKRGLSPIIATVLLIAIVIVIATIVFLWLKGITQEAITKFDGQNIKMVCEDVQFDASFSTPDVYILNTGNVPIYRMKAKFFETGEHKTQTLTGNEGKDWPDVGLTQGQAFSMDVSEILLTVDDLNKIILVPVLVGSSSKGPSTYTCEERHGYELIASV